MRDNSIDIASRPALNFYRALVKEEIRRDDRTEKLTWKQWNSYCLEEMEKCGAKINGDYYLFETEEEKLLFILKWA